ncbi:MAG: hypothetical protein ACREDW_02865, partial [Aestuariivirgaceae bacterium]
MKGQTTWIAHGQPWTMPNDGPGLREDHTLQREGFIKLVQGPTGTEIKWSVFAANWASLFYILEWVETLPPPVTLKYFLVGWFEETIATGKAARDRIEKILAKSDIHLTQRTFVREADPSRDDMPALLKSALRDRAVLPDYSIDCFLDEAHGSFRVGRIGSETPIAKVYGFHPVSYPCINGLSYDHLVSQAYGSVVKTGQP